AGAAWKPCGSADADDSMLALWLQLLYRLAPDSGIPTEWQVSVQKAQAQLAKLRNGRLGIYHVSGRNHVALFMDNVEVYSGLEDRYDPHPWGLVALAAMKMGDQSSALCWLTHSESLRYSPRWNILEEAVFQGLDRQMQAQRSASATACSKTMNQETPGEL